jgi:hypothetical protein
MWVKKPSLTLSYVFASIYEDCGIGLFGEEEKRRRKSTTSAVKKIFLKIGSVQRQLRQTHFGRSVVKSGFATASGRVRPGPLLVSELQQRGS